MAREAEEGAVAAGLMALPMVPVLARMGAFEEAAAAAAAKEEEEEEEEEEDDEAKGTLLLLLRRCSCKGNRGADAAAAAPPPPPLPPPPPEGPRMCMANSFKLSKAFCRKRPSISVVSPLGTNTGRPSI